MKKKLLHSIDLIRKAEKIALIYDPENGFYNTFSAGKDSQAMYYVVKMAGVKFQTHMNFTSVDPPQVVKFAKKEYPDVIKHAPEKSIYQLAIERGILPSMRIRWCCADLKESAGAGKVTLIGIRKEESTRRARRHEVEVSNKAFSGDLDEFEQWQKEQIAKKEAKLIRKMKREGKKVNEDEFSLQKDNEVRCINGKDSILISPIFEWTEKDVWYFLNEVIKAPHCELYDQGYKRIGCILCPMSSQKQKARELKDFPHVKRNWIKAIKAIRRGGVFERGYIWWNVPANGTTSNVNGMLRNWERNYPPRMGENQATSQRMDDGSRTDSNAVHRFGVRYGMQFYRTQFAPPLEQEMQQRTMGGFSDNPSSDGTVEGYNEPTEDEIAEKIFDWWTSGKAYSKWYADKYLQQHIDFDFEDEDN